MEIRRGTIKSFDAAIYKASVQVAGSLAVWLEGVAVARNIPAAEMIPGRPCALLFFDDSNPQDGLVLAVYT